MDSAIAVQEDSREIHHTGTATKEAAADCPQW
jgi:hypothetical protein